MCQCEEKKKLCLWVGGPLRWLNEKKKRSCSHTTRALKSGEKEGGKRKGKDGESVYLFERISHDHY